jgi:hypothetical protein
MFFRNNQQDAEYYNQFLLNGALLLAIMIWHISGKFSGKFAVLPLMMG